jgi:membrane protein implicated in regulation of membrane protease activity
MILELLLQDPQSTPEGQSFFTQLTEYLQPDVLMSWEFWTVASALLLVGELLTASFLLCAFVPGTAVSAVLAGLGIGMQGQLWGFIFGTLFGLVYLRPKLVAKTQEGGVPSNVDALVGQAGVVTEPISAATLGRVKIRSEEWRAASGQDLEVGTRVQVVSVEGNAVHVQPQA